MMRHLQRLSFGLAWSMVLGFVTWSALLLAAMQDARAELSDLQGQLSHLREAEAGWCRLGEPANDALHTHDVAGARLRLDEAVASWSALRPGLSAPVAAALAAPQAELLAATRETLERADVGPDTAPDAAARAPADAGESMLRADLVTHAGEALLRAEGGRLEAAVDVRLAQQRRRMAQAYAILVACLGLRWSGAGTRPAPGQGTGGVGQARRGAPATLLEEAGDRAAAALGGDLGGAFLLAPGEHVRPCGGRGWLPHGPGVGLADGRPGALLGRALAGEAATSCHDADAGAPLLRRHGVVGGLAVPIRGARRVVGALAVFTRRERAFSGEDVAFVQALADVLPTALERHHTAQQRRRAAAVREPRLARGARLRAARTCSRTRATWCIARDGRRLELEANLSSRASERRRVEGRARAIEKLEVVGRLAGGVAHDFNNALTVINGNAELVHGQLDERHPARR